MAKVIILANQKGGVGKSTLAINLTHAFGEKARPVLFDADRQGTTLQTAEFKKTFKAQLYEHQDLRNADGNIVIVDTPPYLSENLPVIFAQADLIIIPTKASLADVLALRSTMMLIKEAQRKNPNLQAAVLYNMVKHGTTLTEEVQASVEAFGFPSFQTLIYDRTNYARSIGIEAGVYGLEDRKIEKEFDAFVKEILLSFQVENYFLHNKELIQ